MRLFIEEDERIDVKFDEGTIIVRRMPLSQQKSIQRRHTKVKVRREGRDEDFNFDPYMMEVIRWGVLDWDITRESTGQKVPYDPELLDKLETRALETLFAVISGREEEILGGEVSEKNFSASSADGETSPGPTVARVSG